MPKNLIFSKTLFWTLFPGLFWIAFFCMRGFFYHPWCAVQPTPCTLDHLNRLDQMTFGFHSIFADFLSNLVQNSCGVILFILPVVLLKQRRRLLRLEALLLQGTLLNGACLELVRSFVQRPRPLVLHDPLGEGSRLYQYTSFYSGHTSFVAYACLITALWFKAELGPSNPRFRWAILAWAGLTLITAALRILGGRHYLTDTLAGAISTHEPSRRHFRPSSSA